MSYEPFDRTLPSGGTDASAAALPGDTRRNLLAVRDGVVLGGMPGWSGEPQNADGTTPVNNTAEPPQVLEWHGNEQWLHEFTWGTAGGSLGHPTLVVHSYSSDGGQTFTEVYRETINYNADETIASYTSTWS